MKPQYEHDCTSCTFLGSHRDHDLYACESGCPGYAWPTVIARHSSEISDYMSGLTIAEDIEKRGYTDHPMVVALHRARERKLV